MRSAERCKSGQFRTALWGSFGLLALAAFSFIFLFSGDWEEEYRQLIEGNDASPMLAKQERKGVSKEILYMQGDVRLALKLEAAHSVLELNANKELVEKLQEVTGLMQEELTASNQTLRHFEAQSAVYYYRENRLVVTNAKVSRYTLPGNRLPKSVEGLQPTMTGVANRAEITLAEGAPRFKAEKLKAAFYEEER